MKNVTLMLVVCVFALSASAQNAADALRYSQITFGGTARGMGLAGAVGSLGADVTDLSVNPAGLGLFRSGEIEITPTLFMLNNSTNYFGTSSTTNNSRLGIENFGMVFTHNVGQPYSRYRQRYKHRESDNTTTNNSKWKTVSFGIAYNRLNNFNENFYYQGNNPNNSITDAWAQELTSNNVAPSQAYGFDQFGAGLAYENFLVNPLASDSFQYTGTKPPGSVTQTESEQISGSQNEFDLSLGANYNDKLFLGVTIGIPTIEYDVNSVYTESSNSASIPTYDFQNLNYAQELSTTGTGFNAKFGIIYKVNDYLRLGIAAHTPTWYSMQDSYSSALSANIDSAGILYSESLQSPLGSYNYSLVTPWRFVGSATVLFKQYGFITADYEYVDYSQAYYDFNNAGSTSDIDYQNQINKSIQTAFAPASIFRVGAEFAYDIFRIRGGFAYYGTPYQSGQAGQGGDQSVENITGGVGLRLDHVFIDAAYVYSMTNSTYYPYSVETMSPDVTEKNTSGNIVLTLGYKF